MGIFLVLGYVSLLTSMLDFDMICLNLLNTPSLPQKQPSPNISIGFVQLWNKLVKPYFLKNTKNAVFYAIFVTLQACS